MKEFLKKVSAFFVTLGKSLMLPIAVLPIAGILLRFGQPDMLNIQFLAAAGNAILSTTNLPIIFALGVAVGFAKEEHGAAALSAFVGYMVMTAVVKIFDSTIDMQVLGGIIMGITAGTLYNKYKAIKLPPFLAFFGGRRFVPIITGLFAIIYGLIFAFIWPPISHLISSFGNWVIASNNIGLFFFGINIQNFSTKISVRRFSPYETFKTLQKKLRERFARAEISNVESFAGFVCTK